MTNTKEIGEIFKCSVCGNIVEVLYVGGGELVCCGKKMEKMPEKNKDPKIGEKHIPIIKKMPPSECKIQDGYLIKVGFNEHPMIKEHYIEWIEIVTQDNKRGKKFLKPGDKPEVEFQTRSNIKFARAFCNIHGLWKSSK